jgi:hypothetical protein
MTKTLKVATCKDKNIKDYKLYRQKHQTSKVITCKDKTPRVTTCTE